MFGCGFVFVFGFFWGVFCFGGFDSGVGVVYSRWGAFLALLSHTIKS